MSVVIGGPLGLGLVSATRPYRNIAGDHLTQNLHHDQGQHPYSAYEFVHLIEGRIVITPDGGTPVTVVAGDAFVVEKDFKGTWKIEEKVRKHFDFRLR
ncbi:MAG: cupin domain-containing protein [Rhodobacter sp.]|nr:cupin domain-containing protein [Rhodobacter sp.]MCA3459772.1 cupin domain-containing protein [Rhodobacter sp.]MCA3465648.1 cupin domain-containing protein [Rhodobacter sp.]MCA3467862.1 cupin domain-containing protein [Rhodobacter sp.]MCA3471572.1 cupin domain-containing protein [Rhodobacter sp.]